MNEGFDETIIFIFEIMTLNSNKFYTESEVTTAEIGLQSQASNRQYHFQYSVNSIDF